MTEQMRLDLIITLINGNPMLEMDDIIAAARAAEAFIEGREKE